jgi:hypothetical protein
VTPPQCRMARAALRIGVRELAGMVKVAPGSVVRRLRPKPKGRGK